MQLAVACRATTMPCRSISLIQWIYCKFGEFICVVTPPISRHVDPHFFSTRETREASPLRAIAHCVSDAASADSPRIARVLIKRMREAFSSGISLVYVYRLSSTVPVLSSAITSK